MTPPPSADTCGSDVPPAAYEPSRLEREWLRDRMRPALKWMAKRDINHAWECYALREDGYYYTVTIARHRKATPDEMAAEGLA